MSVTDPEPQLYDPVRHRGSLIHRAHIPAYEGDKWDRQRHETPRAHAMFTYYRDLGPTRTAQPVADRYGLLVSGVHTLMRNYRWVERAAAWDEHLDLIAREAAETERKDMVVRHLRAAKRAQRKADKAIRSLTAEDLAVLARTKPADVWRIFEGAVKVEREARGLPTVTAAEDARTPNARLALRLVANREARGLMLDAFDMLAETGGDPEPIVAASYPTDPGQEGG